MQGVAYAERLRAATTRRQAAAVQLPTAHLRTGFQECTATRNPLVQRQPRLSTLSRFMLISGYLHPRGMMYRGTGLRQRSFQRSIRLQNALESHLLRDSLQRVETRKKRYESYSVLNVPRKIKRFVM